MEAIYSNWFIKQVAKGTVAFFSAMILSALLFSSLGYIEYSQAESANTLVQINVAPVLDLRVEKSGAAITELELSVTPTAAGDFAKDDLDVIVNTSNATGYTLTFADKDTDIAMHNTVTTVTDTIASLSTYASEQTFAGNTWGYSTGDISQATQVFSPIPLSTAPANIKTTTAAVTEDTTKVTFATKVDTNIESGTYQDTVVFTAIANYMPPYTSTFTVAPVTTTNLAGGDTFTLDTDINWIDNLGQMLVTIYPAANPTDAATCTNPTASKYQVSGVEKLRVTCTSPARVAGTYNVDLELLSLNRKFTASNTVEYEQPGLTGLTNMQEMTTDVCTNSAVGDTATLTDIRDNNTYTVRKMEDNNCWMTQNLRLGSTSAAVTLTSSDSDVSANFTIPTSAVQTSGSTDWSGIVDAVHVYNNGNRWIAPTSSGNSATVNTTGTPPSQSQYIGNYYNWYTTTAGTGTSSMSSGNATSSICPKGWKLPTSGSTTADFNSLTQAIVQVNTNTDSVPDKSFTMQSAPNYFVLSGYYGSSVGRQGSSGYWWSSTAGSSSNVYNLYLNTTRVYPQDSNYKNNGFSVRCMAR